MGIVERLRKMVDATQWEYAWQVERQQRLDIRQSAALLERAGKVLNDLQHSRHVRGYGETCPVCEILEENGHAVNCELAAILRELE